MKIKKKKQILFLTGLPTYIFATILSLIIIENLYFALILMLVFSALYDIIYGITFPNFEINKQYNKLALLVVLQVIFWLGLFQVVG